MEELGIDEEIAQQIIILHGKDIEKLKDQKEAAEATAKQFEDQLAEASATIEGFKELDIDGIKAAADEWKAKAETTAKEAEETVKKLKFEHKLEDHLKSAKAKNIKAVKALLEMDKIALGEDDSLSGLDEQLEAIRENDEYLFESDDGTPQIVKGGVSKNIIPDSVVEAAKAAAGVSSR